MVPRLRRARGTQEGPGRPRGSPHSAVPLGEERVSTVFEWDDIDLLRRHSPLVGPVKMT